jgi:hypothetical protein
MNHSSGVIVQVAAGGLFSGSPRALPSQVYVMAYNDGRVRALPGAPTASDRWGSRFCYIVDTAEQRTRGSFSVPARGDAYSFEAEVEATWKVTDPEAVVRAGLTDGEGVVLGRLKDVLWQLGRTFRPDEARGAESAARDVLRGLLPLDEGLTVLRSSVRFSTDRRITSAVVQSDSDTLQQSREAQRMRSLQSLVTGDESMLLMHLMQHPDDTREVLNMIIGARERNETVRLGLLDRMLANGFIQDGDLQGLREGVLGSAGAGQSISLGQAGSPPAISAGGASPAPGAGSGTSGSAGAAQPKPTRVYAVEDDVAGSSPAPDPGNQAGGVKRWRTVGKPQGSSD